MVSPRYALPKHRAINAENAEAQGLREKIKTREERSNGTTKPPAKQW